MTDSKFKKGDIVYHVRGGRGEVLDTQNDCSTNPPTKLVTVRVMDTCFDDIRKLNESQLPPAKAGGL